MKIVNLEPRSPEWYEFRRTRITATDFARFMAHKEISKCPFNESFHRLLFNKKNGIELEDNIYLKRGRELEPIIMDRYNLEHLTNYKPAVGVSQGRDRYMASLDGFIGKGLPTLEIKTTSKPQEEWDALIDYYKWQAFHQMRVNEAEECIIIMVDSKTANEDYIYKIYHFKLFDFLFSTIPLITYTHWENYCNEFLNLLDNFGKAEDIVSDYIQIEEEIKELEKIRAVIKKRLLDENPEGLVNERLTITKGIRQSVDYKQMVKDNDLEMLDKYKSAVITYTVRIK